MMFVQPKALKIAELLAAAHKLGPKTTTSVLIECNGPIDALLAALTMYEMDRFVVSLPVHARFADPPEVVGNWDILRPPEDINQPPDTDQDLKTLLESFGLGISQPMDEEILTLVE